VETELVSLGDCVVFELIEEFSTGIIVQAEKRAEMLQSIANILNFFINRSPFSSLRRGVPRRSPLP
jgi:hypothetical protein